DGPALAQFQTAEGEARVYGNRLMQSPAEGIPTIFDLLQTDTAAMHEINEAIRSLEQMPLRNGCLRQLRARRGDVLRHSEFSLILHVKASHGLAVVTDVQAPSKDGWPDFFDDTTRECYVATLVNQPFTVDHDFEYDVAYPFCVNSVTDRGSQ